MPHCSGQREELECCVSSVEPLECCRDTCAADCGVELLQNFDKCSHLDTTMRIPALGANSELADASSWYCGRGLWLDKVGKDAFSIGSTNTVSN
jgi:hypothetical protein